MLVPLELITPVNVIDDPVLVPPDIISDVMEDPEDPDGITEDPPETEFVPLLDPEPEGLNNVTVVPVLVTPALDDVVVFNVLVNVEDVMSVPVELIFKVVVEEDGPENVPEDPLEVVLDIPE